jgi:hypothetical protein
MIDLIIATALMLQAPNPCDTIAGSQSVLAGAPVRIQACHPLNDVVAGFDATFDADPLIWTQPATDLGVSSVTGKRAWQASFQRSLAIGPHTVKLKAWNWKSDESGTLTTEKQHSPEVTVAFSAVAELPPPQAAQTVTVTPTAATGGQALAISWTCSSGCTAKDWVGIFPKGATGPGTDIWWPNVYTNGAASGSYSTAKAPLVAGAYEVRYCKNDGYTCTAVAPFTVAASTAPITKLACSYVLTFAVTTQNNISSVSQPVITGSCK